MSNPITPNSATVISPPEPSALTTLISETYNNSPDPLSALTTQVFHNLQHQHLWTSLKIHNPQYDSSSSISTPNIPQPLISGFPPHRMYTHPDEQLYLLELGLREQDLPSERIWVLPTTQGQKWTLGKLATIFDSLPPRILESDLIEKAKQIGGGNGKDKEAQITQYFEKRQQADDKKEWGGKRLLLAMVDRVMGGDGTVVYYVIHDGIVKPRQN